MTIAPGIRLGPYEIVAPLGAGGMGEVWRARDTRLERDVAIKILPGDFASNPQLKARFEREAKTISQLNHPNVCTLFDVGHHEETDFLVMELIDGESLADRLQKGPLPLDLVLRHGTEIASALDAAHRQGIVHRDLKPGNVMLTKSGAKLLDFGLAKSGPLVTSSPSVSELADSPTEHKPLTEQGTILGTFQYMAPEQLEGTEADARTDIFAFGAVLYEMATGRRAFQGKNKTSLIAAIVSGTPPPISEVAPLSPPALEHVIRKCLAKDPDDRWQSAHDVASELRWLSEAGSLAGVAAPVTIRRKSRERLAWTLAIVMTAIALASSLALLTRRETPRRLIESSIVVPATERVALNGGLALSPDGKTAAVVFNDMRGNNTLWLRSLDAPAFRQLAGTDDASCPFWSPDSRKVGFFAAGRLKTTDIQSGAVTDVCDAAAGRGASWSSAGSILFTPGSTGPLLTVRASGGSPAPLTKLRAGDTSHRWPSFLPDGKTFIFLALNESAASSAICQASLDRPEEISVVVPASSSAAYVPPGFLLYARDNLVLAQRYDSKKASTIGEPVTLTDRVAVTDRFFALFSAANDGTLLLLRGAGFVFSQLVWVDRSGKPEGTVTDPGLYFSPSLSRDERRLAVDLSNTTDGQGDIWIHDLARNVSTRLTYEETNESAPQWSPDDKRIIYYAAAQGMGNIFEIQSGGTGQSQLLVDDELEKRPTDVSLDGRWIVFNSAGGASGTGADIGVWSVSEKKATQWLATPFNEQCAQLSPDGKWIAYQSDESGRSEIYVRAFPDSDQKWMISNGGGIMPAWRGDGREIYYVSLDREMMAVEVTPGASFETASPVVLFDAPVRIHPTIQYDVSRDGQRFLLNRLVESSAVEPLTMLQNWDLKLEEK